MSKVVSITFLGIPNSGKSSLVNALSKKNISIVSSKPQTTQELTDSIYSANGISIVLLDTPGINYKSTGIRGIVNKVALSSLSQSMHYFIIIPANKPYVPNISYFDFSQSYFIITKIDTLPENDLLLVTQELFYKYNPKEIFFTSVYRPEKIMVLEEFIESLPGGDYTVLGDTSVSDEEICDLKTKEQLFKLLDKEVPYHCIVKTKSIELKENRLVVHQVIYVPRVAYRKIILGGLLIKTIREHAEINISKALKKKTRLFIDVIVRQLNVPEILSSKKYTGCTNSIFVKDHEHHNVKT